MYTISQGVKNIMGLHAKWVHHDKCKPGFSHFPGREKDTSFFVIQVLRKSFIKF